MTRLRIFTTILLVLIVLVTYLLYAPFGVLSALIAFTLCVLIIENQSDYAIPYREGVTNTETYDPGFKTFFDKKLSINLFKKKRT